MLYLDQPIRIGDFCTFGDKTGTVETIGERSTKVRAVLLPFPTPRMSDMQLINWAKCDRMLITATIGLRYQTDSDQLRYIMGKMRGMLHAHPKIHSDTVSVRFSAYGLSSLDVGVRTYALTREWNKSLAIREDVFPRIKDIVEKSCSGFAFPSQTLYMGRDDGLDTKQTETAVREVQSWRRAGKLPFPRLAADRIDKLENTLDYPPRGSVEIGLPEEELQEAVEPLSNEPDIKDEDNLKRPSENASIQV
jgi:MscS family membrane protein